MKTKFTYLFCLFCICTSLRAQTSKDYAVMLQSAMAVSPPSITLKWLPDASATGYLVFRKEKSDLDWGIPLATLSASATQYTDANVIIGKGYEYYVRRTYSSATQLAHGYMYAGIDLPVTHARGKMLMLIDENYAQPLATEIAQLKSDLIKDGWFVKEQVIARNTAVTAVKAIITAEYNNAVDTGSKKLKAVYLLGRVPVPYSGFINPDGHPDHKGAWPADVYYGVMDNSWWSDTDINDVQASDVRNHNEIGDGKFDQDYVFNLSNDVSLQIGRVDLTNMPAFGISDTALVQQYLQKAHSYKAGQMPVVRRGLIDDNFGAMAGEAFASSGYRNFSTMFGDSVVDRDFFTSIKQDNYLFSYGCGGGTYTSAAGIGSTSDFNDQSVNTVFTMLFGSYFGDWDSQDNFLRAPLCSPKTGLTCAWSGRPYWQFHHMTLGENIGYSARVTQSNYSDFTGGNHLGYAYNYAPTYIHIALMGDPSLRLHTVNPATNLSFTTVNGSQVKLTWNKSTDPDVSSYNIYVSTTLDQPFIYVGNIASTDSSYIHTNPFSGNNIYMVRAVKLEQTPSGSYYNMSLGEMDSLSVTTGIAAIRHALQVVLYPNPTNGLINLGVDDQLKGEKIVTCYDYSGKLVTTLHSSANKINLDLSAFSKGLYLVKVQCGDAEAVHKIILE